MSPADNNAATATTEGSEAESLSILEAGRRQIVYRMETEQRKELMDRLRTAVWQVTMLPEPHPERNHALVQAVVQLGSVLVDRTSSRFKASRPEDRAETILLRMCIEALQHANLPGCFGFSHRGRWETELVYCNMGSLASALYGIPSCR